MKKKTIIFIQNIDYPQQWAVDIFYYSKYLSKSKKYNIKVIVSKINEDISHSELELIELWKLNYFMFVLKSFLEIKRINKKEEVVYVYFFAQHPLSVILQFFTKYCLKLKTIYDAVSWPIWKWLIPFISKVTIKIGVLLADKYIIIDNWLITKLDLPRNKKHIVIWMWYDEELFYENNDQNLFNKQDNEIIFTYIWTLNKERNLDVFLKAFIENLKLNKNIRLNIIWFWSWEEELKKISWIYLSEYILS